jgi:RimJ/RimL family protein N-acetyltransferase
MTYENLILRQFTADDIHALFAILRDAEANTFLPWFPAKSLAEAAEFYQKNYAEAQSDTYKYAVCLKSDNIPIGYVHIGGGDSYDLGYGLRKEFWHRGITTGPARRWLSGCVKLISRISPPRTTRTIPAAGT